MSTLASAYRASTPSPSGTRDAPRSRARTGPTAGPEPSLPEWSPLTANVPSSSSSRRGRSESRASATVVAAVTEIAGLPRTPAGAADRGRLPSRGETSSRAKSVGRDAPGSRESEYARHRAGASVSNEFLKIRAREKIYDVNLVSKGMPRYEPLLDTYLQDHFNNPSVRKHLQNLGIIDEDGYIIDEREFQYIQLALDRQDKEAQVDLQNQQRDIDREVEVVLRAEGYPPCHKGKHHEHDFWSPLVEEYTRSLLPPIRSPRKVTPTGLASRYVKPGKRSTSTPPTAAASAGSDPFPLSPGRARGASAGAAAVPITSIRASDIVYGDDFDSGEFIGGEPVDLDELLAESATPVRAKSPPLRPIEQQRPSSQDQALQTSAPDLQSRTTSMPAVAEEEVEVGPAAACDASTTQGITVEELDAIRHQLAGAKDLLKSGDDARAHAAAAQAAATLSTALPTAGAAQGAVSALLGEAHFIQARAMHHHGDAAGRDVALDAAFRHGADSPHLVRDLVLFKQHCEAADKSANRTQDASILDSPEFTRTERMLLEYILSLGGNLAEAVQQVRANRAAAASAAVETAQQAEPRQASRPASGRATSAHATAAPATTDAPAAQRASRPASASKTADQGAPSAPAAPRSSSRPASARSRRASASVKHSNAALAMGAAAAAVAVGAGAVAAAMVMGRREKESHDDAHHVAVPPHEDAKHDAAPAEPVAVEPVAVEPVAVEPAAASPVPKGPVDAVKPEPEVHEQPTELPVHSENPEPAQATDAPDAVAPAQASVAATHEDVPAPQARSDENEYGADFDDEPAHASDAAADSVEPAHVALPKSVAASHALGLDDSLSPAHVALPKSVAASHALGLNDSASPAHVALPKSAAASHALGLNDPAPAPPGPDAGDHDVYADDADFEPVVHNDEMPYSTTAAAGIALPASVAASQTLAKSQTLAQSQSQTLAPQHPQVMNASFAAGFALPASVAASEQHLDTTTYPIDMAAVRLPPSTPSSTTSSRYASAASVHGQGSSFAAPWTVPLPESRSNMSAASRAGSAPIRPAYDQVPLPPSRAASQALGGAGAGGAVGRRAESVATLARRTHLPRSVTGSCASMGVSRSVAGSRAGLAGEVGKKGGEQRDPSKVPLPASVAGSRMLLKD
ncbi:hypothetical protein GGF32_001925 [Allomyces javanicus]|nr:hypothetical protein GGF32_001925 [Allomyces javanicus]